MNERISFFGLFGESKPIIGMIHLAGDGRVEKVGRALEELRIYQEEGISGAIIENYNGSAEYVGRVLENVQGRFNLILGVNILGQPYSAFALANKYGTRFVQFDSVQTKDLDLEWYNEMREKFPQIAVLGGVGFKYIAPTGNPLEVDLREGRSRCEAIVTTGVGTGIETPLEKLRLYKSLLGDFPLVVGAGVNSNNVSDQLSVCDGAIVGSCFKPNGKTELPVDRERVKALVGLARTVMN